MTTKQQTPGSERLAELLERCKLGTLTANKFSVRISGGYELAGVWKFLYREADDSEVALSEDGVAAYADLFALAPTLAAQLAKAEKSAEAGMTAVLDSVVEDVAELPDRTSPEDAPDMMLVTGDELRAIVAHHVAAFAAARQQKLVEALRGLTQDTKALRELLNGDQVFDLPRRQRTLRLGRPDDARQRVREMRRGDRQRRGCSGGSRGDPWLAR